MTTRVNNRMIEGAPTNILDFGADSEGLLDSTSAIREALQFAETSGSYSIYIPSGTYLLTDDLALPTGMSVAGASRGTSILQQTVADKNIFTLDGTGGDRLLNISIRDLTIVGDWDEIAHTGTTGSGIFLKRCGNGLTIDNCDIRKNKIGIESEDTFTVAMYACRCQHNGEQGISLSTASNSWSINGCEFNFNGTSGARIGGLGNTLNGCNLEGNEEEQLILLGRSNSMVGGYIEKPTGDFAMVLLDSANGWTINGVFIDTLGGSGSPSGGQFKMIKCVNGAQHGEVTKSTLLKNSDNDGLEVWVDSTSGGNNAFWLRETDVFQNDAASTNKRLATVRVNQEWGFSTSVSHNGTIAHGMGEVPNRINITPIGASPTIMQVLARDAVNLTIGVWDTDGNEINAPRSCSFTVSR